MKTISDVRGDMLRNTGGFLILTKSVKEILRDHTFVFVGCHRMSKTQVAD